MSNSPSLPIRVPSEELSALIANTAENLAGFTRRWLEVRDLGFKEGFSEQELQDMVRTVLRSNLESLGVEKPKIKNTLYYLFHSKEQKERVKNNSLKLKTNDHNNDIEQCSSGNGASFDELLEENNRLTNELKQSKKDFESATFEGKTSDDFLIIKKDNNSNNYLPLVTAVEAAGLLKTLVPADKLINIGWEEI